MAKRKIWQERQDERVEEAINAASELFLEQGIEKVKMTDIAEKAGFGVASLYRYEETATKEKIAISVGIRLWNDLIEGYKKVFLSEEFLSDSGIGKMSRILDLYRDLMANHRDFIRYIDEFDGFCIKNRIPQEHLTVYEERVLGFFPYYESAFESGLRDQTIRSDLDMDLLYITVNHAMMGTIKKIVIGEILNEDILSGQSELEMLKEAFLGYIKN